MRNPTPMMQQYLAAKEAHPGVLIAMRVGDFYEFYGPDAEAAAELLQITLTSREDATNGRIAMAGVPYHSVEKYLARLISAGQKVALCDQIEDPKKAKGLVKRAVTRVLTPGTVLEESMLPAGANNFLVAVDGMDDHWAIASLDVSTGELFVTELDGQDRLLSELARLNPSEILFTKRSKELCMGFNQMVKLSISETPPLAPARAFEVIQEHFKVDRLDGFGLSEGGLAVVVVAAVLAYARHNVLDLQHVETVGTYTLDQFMSIDVSTRRALELTQSLTEVGRKHTLLSTLNETVTSSGERLLRRWIEQPLLDAEEIRSRQSAIGELHQQNLRRADLRDALRAVGDLERLVGRCSQGIAGPRDLGAVLRTLRQLPHVNHVVSHFESPRLSAQLVEAPAHLHEDMEQALVDDLPFHARDGGIFRTGYHAELDELREMSRDGRKFIADLEQAERDRTEIANLKVGFNNVFGYYLEVSKAQLDKVPENYIRKQTTTNTERYITAELKDLEAKVLGASEKAQAIEAELFVALRSRVASEQSALTKIARGLAELDVTAGLAEVARKRDYRRPEIVDEDVLDVHSGRHPVVEANTPNFVPNHLKFEAGERLMILTGPNMSGKSTYLRQCALIVLMAQMGSFVPANQCRLGLCDRVFARIGARDEIALGQSTFMVEMLESATILNNATERSLVILDEVGRGTSTFDGLAIAWAMMEKLAEIRCKTMFATHYHQLNRLADQLPNVRNYQVAVKESGEELIWTHRVLPGGTDRSYGIHVARKAGVPRSVLARAEEILSNFEQSDRLLAPEVRHESLQMTLFELEDPALVRELKQLDLDRLTPLDALMLLGKWKSEVD